MIWLVGFSVCLLLLLGDCATESPVPNPVWTCLLVLLAALAPPFVAGIQSRLVARRWRGTNEWLRGEPGVFRRILVSHYFFWLGSGAAIMLVLDWPQLVRKVFWSGGVPLIDEIVIASPLIVSALLSWIVIHGVIDSGCDSGYGLPDNSGRSRALAFGQLRTLCGLVFIPVMILFLIRDVFTLYLPDEYLGLAFGVGGGLFFFALTVLYPVIATTMWKTSELPNQSLQEELRRTATDRGMRPIPVQVWHTSDSIVNAVVVGLLPGTRKVFLTDGLLKQFDDREVLAIYRHELGHIARGHLWIRLLVLVLPILILSLAWFSLLGSGVIPPASADYFILYGLVFAGLAGLWWFVATTVFRTCEISADRFAQLDAIGQPSSELAGEYCSALLKIAMVNPESWSRGTMIHPSIRSRIQAVAARGGIDPMGQLESSCPAKT